MKTPNLWQKLASAFKNPFKKYPKITPIEPVPVGGGGYRISIYHDSPTAFKHRKRRKRLENRARAINYKNQ